MLKLWFAVTLGKALIWGLKTFALGSGSSMPGKLALKLNPQLFAQLARQISYKVVVTGTNGKSTTSGLLVNFYLAQGKTVVHNHLGANMLNGLTTALIQAANLKGQLVADVAVLEIDEATLPTVASDLKQNLTVVTNLFRDQLDRYGELDTTAKLIAQGIEKSGGQMLLNADDPMVSHIAEILPEQKAHYYGFSKLVQSLGQPKQPELLQSVPIPSEVTDCPSCQAKLNYQWQSYGHLGEYVCSQCSVKHPQTAYTLGIIENNTEKNIQLFETASGKQFAFNFSLSGRFNAYNFLAAASAFCLNSATDFDTAATFIEKGLQNYHSIFGRSEKKVINGKSVLIYLIKNPIGASEVLQTVAQDQNRQVLILINDDYADGRDISWLWDAPFEWLTKGSKFPVMVSGRRGADMALRLLYAGLPQSHIELIEDTESAFEQALAFTQAGQTLYVLPTYTALLSLSKRLGSR